jgi:diguanylate cyclase (GGDEF)-like protein
MKTTKHIETIAEERPQGLNQLATFSEIGKTLASSLNLNEILKAVMKQISASLQPKNWSLMLLDEEKKDLYYEIAVGEGSEKIKDLRLKLGEGIAGWVAREGKPLLVPDVKKDPRFSNKADELSNFKTTSSICVPLKTKGKCHGVIELINKVKEDGNFGEEDLLLLTTLADYTAIAIENAKLFDKVQELTVRDDLTQLYNSRYLHRCLDNEVERARRYKYDLSMIFLDLDYFKHINDNHGHICGSKLLSEVADLICSNIRFIDVGCRYGGDEVVIVMPETSKENAVFVAEKLRTSFKNHCFLTEEGVNCKVTASFGVSSYPKDAKDKLELIHLADQAMYRVKNRSRDGVEPA